MNQVGRYQILDELGRGAMGVVYKALDPAIGRTVAIKSIRLMDLTDPAERQRVRDRLLREAQSAGVLSHPNIVTIYDVLEKEDFAYIFMEYVNGSSLESMLRKRSLPESGALLQFLRQVADALDYAHRKGIVHRDIKPANIIISEGAAGAERLAKIADFGVAKFVSHEMTHSGTMIGTPNYMSPEQIEGAPVEGRSDQFSLAVVVYELLTGARPFAGDTLPALFYAICRQEPKAVEQASATLSETVGKVLLRALAKNPKERFALCSDFIGALSIALGECTKWVPVARSAAIADASAFEETASGARQVIRERPLEQQVNASGRTPPPFVSSQPTSAVGTVSDRPVIAPPVAKSYESPTRPRIRRDDEDEETQSSSVGKKLGLILAMLFAIAAAIVFIVRWNSGPPVPVQVLDANSGPAAPPPENADAKRERTPANGKTASHSQPQQPNPARTDNRAEPVAPTAANRETASADVEMLTEPPDAKLMIDNRSDLTCHSPCTLTLPAGRHTLTAEVDGYNMAHRIFTVPEDANLFIPLAKSTGTFLVTSSPSGSTIYVDGKESGQTPATLRLPAGVHHLLVVNGARRQETTIVVQAETLQARSFTW